MLRLKEFVKAINMNWAIGERPYGYDHDAQCSTGPRDHQSISLQQSARTNKKKSSTSVRSRKSKRELYEDPTTGDILIRCNDKRK